MNSEILDGHVIIIEDEEEIRQVISFAAEEAGCKTDAFDDPEKALDALLRNPNLYYGISTDYKCGKDMDGFGFIKKVRGKGESTPRLEVIPITLVSGTVISKATADELRSLGITRENKPFEYERLVDKFKQYRIQAQFLPI